MDQIPSELLSQGPSIALLVWFVISLGRKLDAVQTMLGEVKNAVWRLEERLHVLEEAHNRQHSVKSWMGLDEEDTVTDVKRAASRKE